MAVFTYSYKIKYSDIGTNNKITLRYVWDWYTSNLRQELIEDLKVLVLSFGLKTNMVRGYSIQVNASNGSQYLLIR